MASRRTIRITARSAIRMTEKESLEDRAAAPGAAVAAGIVFGATGSDTGGSIRIPASFCGTVGFKPTFNLVSTEGCFPLGASLDHMGPLARTVEDAALMLEAMAGRKFPVKPRTDVRIAMPENFYFDDIDPEIHVAVEHAAKRAEKMGAKIVRVRVPDPDGLMSTARTILLCEAATVMLPHVKPRHEFGADVLALLDTGAKVTATEYINAVNSASRLKEAWAKQFEHFDVLLTPYHSYYGAAYRADDSSDRKERRGHSTVDDALLSGYQSPRISSVIDSVRLITPRASNGTAACGCLESGRYGPQCWSGVGEPRLGFNTARGRATMPCCPIPLDAPINMTIWFLIGLSFCLSRP